MKPEKPSGFQVLNVSFRVQVRFQKGQVFTPGFGFSAFGYPTTSLSEVWKDLKDDFISSTYDFNYGHCINLDIGQLSKQNGKFPVKVGVDGAKLFLKVFINEKIDHTLKHLFLRGKHGLIDVNAFGLTIFQSQKVNRSCF